MLVFDLKVTFFVNHSGIMICTHSINCFILKVTIFHLIEVLISHLYLSDFVKIRQI